MAMHTLSIEEYKESQKPYLSLSQQKPWLSCEGDYGEMMYTPMGCVFEFPYTLTPYHFSEILSKLEELGYNNTIFTDMKGNIIKTQDKKIHPGQVIVLPEISCILDYNKDELLTQDSLRLIAEVYWIQWLPAASILWTQERTAQIFKLNSPQ